MKKNKIRRFGEFLITSVVFLLGLVIVVPILLKSLDIDSPFNREPVPEKTANIEVNETLRKIQTDQNRPSATDETPDFLKNIIQTEPAPENSLTSRNPFRKPNEPEISDNEPTKPNAFRVESNEMPKESPSRTNTQPQIDFSGLINRVASSAQYRVVYGGENGVSVFKEPNTLSKVVATVFSHEGNVFKVSTSESREEEGVRWLRGTFSGWMPARNLRNGDINVKDTSGGTGIVSWYAPNDDYVSMRPDIYFKGKTYAHVKYKTPVSLGRTQLTEQYEWRWAEFSGWIAEKNKFGQLQIAPVN